MNQAFIAKISIAAVAALMVAGCATKSAPDFGGRWKPVNRFAVATTEIPLYSSYVYQASPMDGTLKAMLERWAKDSGRTLDYRLNSDFTLYGAVSKIDRETGAVEYESTSRGAVSYLNDLHKGRNAGPAWGWFLDLFAVACLVFCITGLFLLHLHARQRRMTWPLVGLGLMIDQYSIRKNL